MAIIILKFCLVIWLYFLSVELNRRELSEKFCGILIGCGKLLKGSGCKGRTAWYYYDCKSACGLRMNAEN